MKDYIKLFNDLQSADGYIIEDIPFTSTVKRETGGGVKPQNVRCNQESKKIEVDEQGNISVVDAGPTMITFTIRHQYSGGGVVYPWSGHDYPWRDMEQTVTCPEGLNWKQFCDSDYNEGYNIMDFVSENKYHECYDDPNYRGSVSWYFGTEECTMGDPRNWGPDSWWVANNNIVLQDGEVYYYVMGGSCLLADTLVTMGDGTTKQIKDIKIGDEVLSLDLETGKQIVRKVIWANGDLNRTSKVWDEWEFSDGTIVKTALRHEFYNVEVGKFKYMDEWKIGEHTRKIDGTEPKLIKHTVHEEAVQHCKIKLENSNNYFANGLLNGDHYCNELNINLK